MIALNKKSVAFGIGGYSGQRLVAADIKFGEGAVKASKSRTLERHVPEETLMRFTYGRTDGLHSKGSAEGAPAQCRQYWRAYEFDHSRQHEHAHIHDAARLPPKPSAEAESSQRIWRDNGHRR